MKLESNYKKLCSVTSNWYDIDSALLESLPYLQRIGCYRFIAQLYILFLYDLCVPEETAYNLSLTVWQCPGHRRKVQYIFVE